MIGGWDLGTEGGEEEVDEEGFQGVFLQIDLCHRGRQISSERGGRRREGARTDLDVLECRFIFQICESGSNERVDVIL